MTRSRPIPNINPTVKAWNNFKNHMIESDKNNDEEDNSCLIRYY